MSRCTQADHESSETHENMLNVISFPSVLFDQLGIPAWDHVWGLIKSPSGETAAAGSGRVPPSVGR